MKLFAVQTQPPQSQPQSLRIDGVPFPVPTSIQHLFDIAGPFGTNILVFGVYVMMVVAILIAIFVLVWGGVNWVTSGGDKTKLQSARNTILYAIIGLVLTLLAFTIINVLGFFFDLSLFGQ